MLWVIAALFFVSFTLLVLAFARPKAKEDVSQRMERLHRQVSIAQDAAAPLTERPSLVRRAWLWGTALMAPLAQRLLSEQMEAAILPRLRRAGWYEVSAGQFVTWQLLSCLTFGCTFLLLFYWDGLPSATFLPGLIGSLALGFYFPRIRLNTVAEKRQKEILKALPDVLDLLTVCIEAGMGLNAALQKVAEQMRPNTLLAELRRTLQEIKVGRPRADALRAMAQRVDIKELTAVVISLVQAEQIGTPLGKTLRVQSEVVRQARWQKAQEMAHKAPVKIVLPVVCLIFPVMFLVIFGPIVLNLLVAKH